MEAVQQLINQFIIFVPNVLSAILILIGGYFVTRLVTGIFKRMLILVGLDKLGARLQQIDVIRRSDIQISLSTIVAQVLYYFMMLIILVAATDVLGMEAVSNLVASAIAYVPNLLAALIILVLGAIVADTLREVTTVACRSIGIPSASLIGSVMFWFVLISILITALSQAQLETNFIVANLSIFFGGLCLAFALAYGLAARPLMGGFLAQFYNRGKINVGDRIRIEGHSGRVVAMDRASLVLDVEGKILLLPLSKLQTESILIEERSPDADPLLTEIVIKSKDEGTASQA